MSVKEVKIVTIGLLLSNTMSGLDNTIINTALPRIVADLKGIEEVGWLVAIFLLGTAVATPIWSKIGERFGNKLAYQLSAGAFVLGAFLQGMAPTMSFLLAARLLAGIGNGGMVSVPYIIYSDLYPNPRHRMRVLGLVSASYSGATICGPLVGGWLVDVLSWHWVFYMNIPFGLISIILIQLFFKEKRKERKTAKLDYLGATLLTMAIVILLIAIQSIGTVQWPILAGLLLTCAALLLALCHVEKTAADPMIPGRLFKNSGLIYDFTMFVLIWAAMMAFSVYAPMWAQGLLATSAFIGGATQIPGAMTDLCSSLAVAPLRRKLTPQQVILLSVVSLFLGYCLMALGSLHLAYGLILLAGMCQGIGNGIVFNELQVKVQQDAQHKDVPVATSFSFLIRMIASSVAAAWFGLILNTQLRAGVHRDPRIHMGMLNELSDAQKARHLPQVLLPAMRGILYSGIHEIMLTSLGLIGIALILALWARHHEKNLNVTAL